TSGHRARAAATVLAKVKTQSFWEFFASRTVNWIAIVAGAIMLTALEVVDSAGGWGSLSVLSGLFLEIGRTILVYGLFFGIIMSWSDYKKMPR
ncbi:MAG: hypothetical protein MUC90_04715, partial [Thermoplasmata archaeon]|nr:hypothetical protein [Thermoplasmata archaeon]